MTSAIQSDYLVLMGPLFRPEIKNIWQESLQKVKSQGTKIIFLGIASIRYEEEYMSIYRDFLKSVQLYLLVSRDTETYIKLGEYAQHANNGIDLAFFIPGYYKLIGLENLNPYVVLNFDKSLEPKIKILQNTTLTPVNKKNEEIFNFEGNTWEIQPDKWRTKIARKSRYLMFLESIIFNGEQTRLIGNYDIIRTDHHYAPIIKQGPFRYPNVMVNDTPFPYFEVYGNAKLILSNRLHACVIGLSYGNLVMLFSESPRLRLIERLNIEGIKNHTVWLDSKYLESEKQQMRLFLSEKIK